MKTDYLIIGSGIAGLTLALKLAQFFENKKITIITKSDDEESNTKYAQGGIAIVSNFINDSFKKHINDTIIAGDGLCKPDVVEMVITKGPELLKELINWGANFDKNSNGELNLGKEGGHSENRIVHHQDQTGFEIERAILNQIKNTPNIKLLDYHFALDLLVLNNNCYGCYVLNEKDEHIFPIHTNYTILATGGIGQLYNISTNPIISTGDGIAMANRAGALIKDMEFIQFHPTAYVNQNKNEVFLISEAVRGFGAYIRNKKGERFLEKIDLRNELASRDIVSKGIFNELKKSKEKNVYLDCTHLNMDQFKYHFPKITNYCKNQNINIETDWIPVQPAQHYLCGGIEVDIHGKTSIENLMACGECSYTGLHGANRLASNSLLEALVYSDNIYNYIKSNPSNDNLPNYFPEHKSLVHQEIQIEFLIEIEEELKNEMSNNVGIIRNNKSLKTFLIKLQNWKSEIEHIYNQYQTTTYLGEIRNMIDVAIIVVENSIKRNKNQGGFYKEKAASKILIYD